MSESRSGNARPERRHKPDLTPLSRGIETQWEYRDGVPTITWETPNRGRPAGGFQRRERGSRKAGASFHGHFSAAKPSRPPLAVGLVPFSTRLLGKHLSATGTTV